MYFIVYLSNYLDLTLAYIPFSKFVKKIKGFSSRGIFYGIITMVIAVNLLFLFSRSAERNNAIKNIAGSPYVEKFIER